MKGNVFYGNSMKICTLDTDAVNASIYRLQKKNNQTTNGNCDICDQGCSIQRSALNEELSNKYCLIGYTSKTRG